MAAILDTAIGHLLANLAWRGAALCLRGVAVPVGGDLVHRHRGGDYYREHQDSGCAYPGVVQ